MGKCLIICAAGFDGFLEPPGAGDFILAADGGYAHCKAFGIAPNEVLGDFDSLGHAPEGERVIRHPVEKDDTDMLLAVRTGMEAGCRDFIIYGGIGGRMDHTYANFQTLIWIARHGGRGYLVGDGMISTVIDSDSISFPASCKGTISIFCPDGEARGVTLKGLQYPLVAATLTSGFPLGVSNSFLGKPAGVSVASGRLMIMWEESVSDLLKRL